MVVVVVDLVDEDEVCRRAARMVCEEETSLYELATKTKNATMFVLRSTVSFLSSGDACESARDLRSLRRCARLVARDIDLEPVIQQECSVFDLRVTAFKVENVHCMLSVWADSSLFRLTRLARSLSLLPFTRKTSSHTRHPTTNTSSSTYNPTLLLTLPFSYTFFHALSLATHASKRALPHSPPLSSQSHLDPTCPTKNCLLYQTKSTTTSTLTPTMMPRWQMVRLLVSGFSCPPSAVLSRFPT